MGIVCWWDEHEANPVQSSQSTANRDPHTTESNSPSCAAGGNEEPPHTHAAPPNLACRCSRSSRPQQHKESLELGMRQHWHYSQWDHPDCQMLGNLLHPMMCTMGWEGCNLCVYSTSLEGKNRAEARRSFFIGCQALRSHKSVSNQSKRQHFRSKIQPIS